MHDSLLSGVGCMSQEYLIVYEAIDQCPLSIDGYFNIKANELWNT